MSQLAENFKAPWKPLQDMLIECKQVLLLLLLTIVLALANSTQASMKCHPFLPVSGQTQGGAWQALQAQAPGTTQIKLQKQIEWAISDSWAGGRTLEHIRKHAWIVFEQERPH